MNIAWRLLLGWLLLALAVLLFYSIVTRPIPWQAFYFDVWLLGFGLPLWMFRCRVTAFLRDWKWPEGIRFVLLAYGMVLLEEIFAALFNHLTEGFRLELYLIRIGQFWVLNIFAFTGLILASGVLYTRIGYTLGEMFVLVGLTGLYSEKVIYALASAPLIFAVVAPVVFFSYGLIMVPSMMSVPARDFRRFSTPVRYALFFATWFSMSIPFIFLLLFLRSRYPAFFPPTSLIP